MKLDAEVIKGFVEGVLKKSFPDAAATPACHLDWWKMCTSNDKFVAIAAPRGHAKSTAITMAYALSCILFRERRFIIIISDTEAQSSLFLNSIKKEILDNEDIRVLFGQTVLLKDAETDFVVRFEDGYEARVMAKGSEQKLRGLKWGNLRPDLIIGDDMENDEIVMNKERRDKFRKWFMGAVLPSLAKDGIIRVIGTILHLDSLLANYMPREHDKDTVVTPLSVLSGPKAIFTSAKYKAHPGMNDYSVLLWPEYKDAEWLKAEKAKYIGQGESDLYAQEYLNEPIDDTNALFKKADFKPMHPDDFNKNINHYISVDLATSKDNVKRDFTVFTVGGVTPDNELQIRYVLKERMDTLQAVEKFIELQRLFNPLFFVTEKGTLTNSILPFLYTKMGEENVWPILKLINNDTDKIRRSSSIRGRMRAGKVRFDKDAEWYPEFEQECIQFPRSRHDDQVDTLSLLGIALDKLIEAPTPEEVEEQEYEDEKMESGFYNDGKSDMCGY